MAAAEGFDFAAKVVKLVPIWLSTNMPKQSITASGVPAHSTTLSRLSG
jgi:hypothetical protein